ncbi:MAG TPA: type II toxin-antitoxin system HicB family antitoxin [Anaerolineales bacterium]|nr:type II toxin-antitoxin system HicB family antitoxin [Anaerolineales bacterium]
MEQPGFIFTGIIFREGEGYTALCPDLDVASQGDSVSETKAALLEAVTLYLETALENNLPWLRPIPRDEDPRFVTPELIMTAFPLKVRTEVYAYA